jgi:integrase
MDLNAQANRMLLVDAPKVERRISPSWAPEHAASLRGKAIISLFADSGIRWGELARIEQGNINREGLDMVVWYTRSLKFEGNLRL